jgi:hypothetical protein
MDISLRGLATTLVFQIPQIIVTLALALIRLIICDKAYPQDFLTELIVAIARPVLGTPASLLLSQTQLNRDRRIWGSIWISKCVIRKPEDYVGGGTNVAGVKEAVYRAIKHLGDDNCEVQNIDVVDVEAEWTGYRSGVSWMASRPNLPEGEQYQKLMDTVLEESPTILYFHGGAFWLVSFLYV